MSTAAIADRIPCVVDSRYDEDDEGSDGNGGTGQSTAEELF